MLGTQDFTSNSKNKDERICGSAPADSVILGAWSLWPLTVLSEAHPAKLGESSRKISPHPPFCFEENPVIPFSFYVWLGDLFPASQQNWHWPSNLRKLELPNSREVTAAASKEAFESWLCCSTWLFLTVHLRACSLFYLHLDLLDPADLFPDSICIACYSKSEKWPAHSFTKFYQLPVVDTLLQKGLKAGALSSNVQPSLALVLAGTGGPKICRPRAYSSVLT